MLTTRMEVTDLINRLAFGDSYTYVQGTYGLQNYSFIGDAFNYSYTPSELLSNTIVQNQVALPISIFWAIFNMRHRLEHRLVDQM